MNKKATIVFLLFSLFIIFTFSTKISGIQEPIKIGVVSMITPVDSVKYYQETIDYISEKLGMPVEMVYRKTYDEMDRMLEKGEVDAAFICVAP
jgi:ABC-type phosphate/phosphonate transport system substrate-binding protein